MGARRPLIARSGITAIAKPELLIGAGPVALSRLEAVAPEGEASTWARPPYWLEFLWWASALAAR
jgi:hypothetical protein